MLIGVGNALEEIDVFHGGLQRRQILSVLVYHSLLVSLISFREKGIQLIRLRRM